MVGADAPTGVFPLTGLASISPLLCRYAQETCRSSQLLLSHTCVCCCCSQIEAMGILHSVSAGAASNQQPAATQQTSSNMAAASSKHPREQQTSLDEDEEERRNRPRVEDAQRIVNSVYALVAAREYIVCKVDPLQPPRVYEPWLPSTFRAHIDAQRLEDLPSLADAKADLKEAKSDLERAKARLHKAAAPVQVPVEPPTVAESIEK